MNHMNTPEPVHFSKRHIDQLGDRLRASGFQDTEAIAEVDRWRASHLYPLNVFWPDLEMAAKDYEGAIVAQRLKRMSTIIDKLRRFPDMNLSRMQDVAGLRFIVNDLAAVYAVRERYSSGFGLSSLKRESNYLIKPKPDGYRGIHLIFEFNSDNSLARPYNGLYIELQIRTHLQHAWATAVEVAGMVRKERLKNGVGDQIWRDFFTFASQVFSVVEQQMNAPGSTSKEQKLALAQACLELVLLDGRHHIIDKLGMYGKAIEKARQKLPEAGHFLITTDIASRRADVVGYSDKFLDRATAEYAKREALNADDDNMDQVLVSVSDVRELENAYPNYFLDVGRFVGFFSEIRNKVHDLQNVWDLL